MKICKFASVNDIEKELLNTHSRLRNLEIYIPEPPNGERAASTALTPFISNLTLPLSAGQYKPSYDAVIMAYYRMRGYTKVVCHNMNDTKQISNEELMQFLDSEELQKILEDYRKASEMAATAGFNVFTIISDYYYRENFHGDILKAFLDPKGKHGEGDKFLKIFIEMLGVEATHYGFKTTIEREVGVSGEDRGRIDFVIKNNDESNPHCIIIENKLYDAVDMPNQLPRYHKEMKERQGYHVDKMVYLPLSVGKRPEGLGKEIEEVLKVEVIPAINVSNSECSLVNNWIDPCIDAASNPDCISILNQYKRLLISLKPEISKYKSSMDFIDYILKDESNLKKVIALKNLLDNLGSSLAIRLAEKLENYGLRVSSAREDNGRMIRLNNYTIYVYCGADNLDYTMRVVDAANNPISIDWLQDSLKNDLQGRVKDNGGGPYIHFKVAEEDKLIKAVQAIVEEAGK